ncbi:MAG: SMI1/KNR4 family protein [Labilithrix sp.]|nr:SMI1/KNR4 family protein [Labilithrix sp.]
MNVDDLVSAVAGEPERVVRLTVRTTPSAVLAQAGKPGGLKLTDLLSASAPHSESRDVRYRHVLGGPASQRAIEAWSERHPSHVLPADLREFVARINGVHLWANLETGRSYTGLAPIEEWDLARTKMYGPTADRRLLDDRYVALSYHQDGASFVVLDVESGTYFLMDTAGPDTSSPIARNADELLDWLWRHRIAPKP